MSVFMAWDFVVTGGWRHQVWRRLGFFPGFYGISVNQTGPWHKLHQFSGHFGYQIASHLINLPVCCHQKLLSTTFTQWYAARLPKASLELCILDIKWSDRAIVWKACGYCVALFVKINFFYRFLWIILASFDRITQSTEREFDMNCIHPVLKQ